MMELHHILLFLIGLLIVAASHTAALVWVAKYLASKWEDSNNRLITMLDHTLDKNSNALNASTAALYFVQAKNGRAVGGAADETTHIGKSYPSHCATDAP